MPLVALNTVVGTLGAFSFLFFLSWIMAVEDAISGT